MLTRVWLRGPGVVGYGGEARVPPTNPSAQGERFVLWNGILVNALLSLDDGVVWGR